jgi:uncharacterized membrane protein YbhN (UPF0104 family)
MKLDVRHALPTVLRWAVALGLIAIVLSRFDLAATAQRIGEASLILAIPAILGLVAIHLVGALAWRRLLERFAGIRSDWQSAIRLYYAAQAIGSITPGNLGADVYRIAAVDAGSSRRTAAIPILLQRVTSTLALGVLAAVGLAVLRWNDIDAAALAVGAVVLVIAAIGWRLAGPAAARWVAGRLPAGGLPTSGLPIDRLPASEPSRGWLNRRADAIAVLRDGFGLGLLFHVASIGLSWVLIVAVDPSMMGRSVDVLAILAIARLSVVLPISPAGLGVQEAAVGILFAEVGLDPQVALAGILLNRVALLIVVVIGAASLLHRPSAAPTAKASRRPALPVRARQ